ncbi:hypothetical protein [Pseudohongiella spirulinae]|uniref:MSHA biogenesis protein MshI n=1 Tax=Pseudohongiella spirulinae TaxID=1249552 RepID=A0A0S2KAP7_9GAMM|nr:hypothetical protein [Pseudohongiella spirulinae]ALO45155.1 hypothetical protein PS2015_469 [Pseudohongiella spirulinae]
MANVTQQVNLYLPELQPSRDLVNAARALQALLVVVVAGALISAVQFWQRSSAQTELALLQEALRVQTVRTEELERDVAARATDQALVREMETRELRLAQARQLYEFMQGTTLGNLVGYSEHFKDLSRASFTGVWLRNINIRGNADSVTIAGAVQQPAMLPDYVGRLSNGRSALSTRRFNRLISTRDESSEQELYEFTLEAGQ